MKKKAGAKPGKPGANKEEVERRINQGVQYLLKYPNARYTDFVAVFKEEWKVEDRMVGHYHKRAKKKISETIDEDILAEKKRATISMMNQLRLAEKDLKLAETVRERSLIRKEILEIRKEINKVLGLYTSNVDITSGGEKVEGFDISKMITFSKPSDDTED